MHARTSTSDRQTHSRMNQIAGTYAVSYTPTKSGNYEAGVKLAKGGGLTGQYFENVWFFYTPVKVHSRLLVLVSDSE